jgi:hypothetical protein
MSSNSRTILSYKNYSNRLIISGDSSVNSVGQGFFPMVHSGFNLFFEGKALIDTIYHTIYVLFNDFKDGYDQLFIINGKRYLQKTKLPNGYGLITEHTTMNKALQKRLKKLNPDTHLVKIYKGYEAYQKFGYNYVLGVIEIYAKL